MRFRSQLTNINTFTKLTASLSSLGKICWVRLEEDCIRFTIIPDQGTQVWAQLPLEILFDSYDLQSASEVINLEVPIGGLHRALRSATGAASARLRLTKKDATPLLALTVVTTSWTTGNNPLNIQTSTAPDDTQGDDPPATARPRQGPRERESVVTQEIPVRVLHESKVDGLHEPRCPKPDVHIILPALMQLKGISERFTKLAIDSASRDGSSTTTSSSPPMLELSANMHGSLKLAIATDALRISTVWTGLVNPPLDPALLSQDEIDQLPSERMRALGNGDGDGDEGWARVRIDGRDWGRVLSVGRLSPKVVACFIHETALILYVYLPGEDDSCLTYYINSYSS